MGSNLATVVVEARLLVREALRSLMASHSYRVVCDAGCTAEISAAGVSDEPKLVILGAQSADNAVGEADAIRKLWPDSKIILLYDHASLADLQKVQTSEIDGCVPLFVSPDTLIGILDLIVIGNARVMVVPDAKCPAIQPAHPEDLHRSDIKIGRLPSYGAEHEDVSVGIRAMHTKSPVNGASTDLSLSNSDTRHVPAAQIHFKLSEREAQILNGLVKGHANKVIARTCDITEATVKVHIKSILRKIRVANRTQAAIWALENGYTAAEIQAPSKLTSNQNAAAITAAAIRSVPLSHVGAAGRS